MSDSEDIQYIKRAKVVHFGSLENEVAELGDASLNNEDNSDKTNISNENEKNVNISKKYLPLENNEEMSEDKKDILAEFERKKLIRSIHVSTDDSVVKQDLRYLGRPICLFGEGPAERRRRLRELLADLGQDAVKQKKIADETRVKEKRVHEQRTWYHEGPESLQIARRWLAKFSLKRAEERIFRLKKEANLSEASQLADRQNVQKRIKALEVQASQIADQRPISCCQFSPDSTMLVTGSWSGTCKLWSVPNCELIRSFGRHLANVGSIVFNPESKMVMNGDEIDLASCSNDGAVKLWSVGSSEPIADIKGHDTRVARCAFHPSGRFLGTCVYDKSWRLWDLEQLTEILHQEGHSKEVHCLAFQIDGSLAVSGGLDSFGRIWDLRTGQCIMFLEGHLQGVICADWSPDGFHVVTGSLDNSVKVWDLRKRSLEYTIPAHTNVVSNVVFEKTSGGQFLLTSSYDLTARVWAAKTWQPLVTLSGHDSRLMGCDVSPNSAMIATCSYDRTFKIWTSEL